jgi:hypothetical protein
VPHNLDSGIGWRSGDRAVRPLHRPPDLYSPSIVLLRLIHKSQVTRSGNFSKGQAMEGLQPLGVVGNPASLSGQKLLVWLKVWTIFFLFTFIPHGQQHRGLRACVCHSHTLTRCTISLSLSPCKMSAQNRPLNDAHAHNEHHVPLSLSVNQQTSEDAVLLQHAFLYATF